MAEAVNMFERVFSDFSQVASKYSPEQQDELLEQTKSGLFQVLTNFHANVNETTKVASLSTRSSPVPEVTVTTPTKHGNISVNEVKSNTPSHVQVKNNAWDDDEIAKILASVRERLYLKSKSLYRLFQEWANIPHDQGITGERVITLDQFGENLVNFGYVDVPHKAAVVDFAKTCAGSHIDQLNYHEFQAFFVGGSKFQPFGVAGKSSQSGAPNVFDTRNRLFVDALLKIGHQNLRRQFKDIDNDKDGYVSILEIGKYFEQHGLHSLLSISESFHRHVESFGKKKPGFLCYAEFITLINQRSDNIDAQLEHPAPVALSDTISIDAAMQAIRAKVREENISMLTVFEKYDLNASGVLNEADFWQSMVEIGFELPSSIVTAFFSACSRLVGGSTKAIHYETFTQAIQYPSRPALQKFFLNPSAVDSDSHVEHSADALHSLGLGHGHAYGSEAPGGESSLPLGKFANLPDIHDEQPSQRAHSNNIKPQFHFSGQGIPEDKKPVRATNTYKTTLDLSEPATFTPSASQAPSISGSGTGGVSQINLSDDQPPPSPRDQATIKHTNVSTFVITDEIEKGATDVSPHGRKGGVGGESSKRYQHSQSHGADHIIGNGSQIPVEASISQKALSKPLSNGISHLKAGCVYEEPFRSHLHINKSPPANTLNGELPGSPDRSRVAVADDITGKDWQLFESACDVIYRYGKVKNFYNEWRTANDMTLDSLMAGLDRARWPLASKPNSKEKLALFFDVFDSNNDGSITYSEFIRMLGQKKEANV